MLLTTTNHSLLDIAYHVIKSEYCAWKMPKKCIIWVLGKCWNLVFFGTGSYWRTV